MPIFVALSNSNCSWQGKLQLCAKAVTVTILSNLAQNAQRSHPASDRTDTVRRLPPTHQTAPQNELQAYAYLHFSAGFRIHVQSDSR